MGHAARKARKRAGVPFVKSQKVATRPWGGKRPQGLGLVTGAEILGVAGHPWARVMHERYDQPRNRFFRVGGRS